jgi:hypothetical protein
MRDIPDGIIAHQSRRPDQQRPRNVSLCHRSPIIMNGSAISISSIKCVPGRNQGELFSVKWFSGQVGRMASSSSPSRRAEALRQQAIIFGHESEPIMFSLLLFAPKCRRYLEELLVGSGPGDIVIDSTLDRDSVTQFIAACDGAEFSLTLSNVFEIKFLCDEWSVVGKSIRKNATEFIEHKGLWLRRLLFRVGRGLISSEAEYLLQPNLAGVVSDSVALEIPAAALSRIIDFRDYEGRTDEYE